jgi:hypothetical protein
MGHIYYRQEKYGMAEYHFRRALAINDRSSVLRCYLGMALARLRRGPEALQMLGQVGDQKGKGANRARVLRAAWWCKGNFSLRPSFQLFNACLWAPICRPLLLTRGTLWRGLSARAC